MKRAYELVEPSDASLIFRCLECAKWIKKSEFKDIPEIDTELASVQRELLTALKRPGLARDVKTRLLDISKIILTNSDLWKERKYKLEKTENNNPLTGGIVAVKNAPEVQQYKDILPNTSGKVEELASSKDRSAVTEMAATSHATASTTSSQKIFLPPSKIKYLQSDIGDHFSSGETIIRTFEDILFGRITLKDIPDIEIVEKWGQSWALTGHRRLFIYKSLENIGVLDKIPVNLRKLSEPEVRNTFRNRNTTVCNGESIGIRETIKDGLTTKIARVISEWRTAQGLDEIERREGVDSQLIQKEVVGPMTLSELENVEAKEVDELSDNLEYVDDDDEEASE